jgi:hypothetical protein
VKTIGVKLGDTRLPNSTRLYSAPSVDPVFETNWLKLPIDTVLLAEKNPFTVFGTVSFGDPHETSGPVFAMMPAGVLLVPADGPMPKVNSQSNRLVELRAALEMVTLHRRT